MQGSVQRATIVALIGIYLVALFAVLHPHVSSAYKAYFLDHSSSDWNPAHYPGSPEQGMNFGREGLPDWVDSTCGLSYRDPMGRWTDRDQARVPAVSFTRSFSGLVCVDITLTPAPALLGKEFAVRMGEQTQTVRLAKPGLSEFRLPFTLERPANKLEFLLPEKLPHESEFDRNSNDTRRLGMSLSTLRLVPGSCSDDRVNRGQ